MRSVQLTVREIKEGLFRQTFYQWLYTWSRHHEEVYVEDQVSGDRFLWIPVDNSLGKIQRNE